MPREVGQKQDLSQQYVIDAYLRQNTELCKQIIQRDDEIAALRQVLATSEESVKAQMAENCRMTKVEAENKQLKEKKQPQAGASG